MGLVLLRTCRPYRALQKTVGFQGLTPLAISSRPFGAPELMPWLKGWPERNKEKEVIRLGDDSTKAQTHQNLGIIRIWVFNGGNDVMEESGSHASVHDPVI